MIIIYVFFFFNDTATTEIYTLSLHDALPILPSDPAIGTLPVRDVEPVTMDGGDVVHDIVVHNGTALGGRATLDGAPLAEDRKSTRLNSSHLVISYAVFCLKKKKN